MGQIRERGEIFPVLCLEGSLRIIVLLYHTALLCRTVLLYRTVLHLEVACQ